MADNETTMKDLLIALRFHLEAERNDTGTLRSVRQVKRGVLPVKPVYPCVTVVPMSEQVVSYRSSRRVLVEREVMLHVLALDPRGKGGLTTAQGICEACLDIIRDNGTAEGSTGATNAMGVTLGGMEFNDGKPIDGAGLYNVSLPATYLSRDALAPLSEVYRDGQNDNATATAIVNAIHTGMAAKSGTTLNQFRRFDAEEWGPNASFPRLLVSAKTERQGKNMAGIDIVSGGYEVLIESLVGTARDTSMDFHLGLLEPVRDALEEEDHWGGKTYSAKVGVIGFNAAQVGGKPVYQTNISYETESIHKA